MEARQGLSSLKARIKRLNARFRRLKRQDGPLAARMRSEKDALIDAMAAACAHEKMIAMKGRKAARGKTPVPPLRLCERCGFCERSPDGSPVGRRRGTEVTVLPFEDYVLRQGLALKKLGINI